MELRSRGGVVSRSPRI